MSPEEMPKHIAFIMDGNGRWAKRRKLPRAAGHKAGVDSVRKIVRRCSDLNIDVITLYAFSSENWKRPKKEVKYLMELYLWAINKEVRKLHENAVRLHVIGDLSMLDDKLHAAIENAMSLTKDNAGLKLVVALNYGGRWDICQATQRIALEVAQQKISPDDIDDAMIANHLSTAGFPDPDLLVRTSGETRISNFLNWQLAYAELYFTDVFWPDFDEQELEKALQYYADRERRFGQVSEQLKG